MESRFTGFVKTESEDYENGDMLEIKFKPLRIIVQSEEIEFDLEHEIEIVKLDDLHPSDEIIANIEVLPRNSSVDELKILYDYLIELDCVNLVGKFDDFCKKTMCITYDFGEMQEIWWMAMAGRTTYLNGSVYADNGVFKYHIVDGKMIEGDKQFDCFRMS